MLYKYIRTFGNLLHCIWPYSLSQRFSRYYAWFYTAWIAHNVRKIGLHTEVEPGLYLVNGKKYIEIGDYCLIGRNSHITAHEMPQYNTPVKISIGDGCMFGPDMHITAVNSIRIGKKRPHGEKRAHFGQFARRSQRYGAPEHRTECPAYLFQRCDRHRRQCVDRGESRDFGRSHDRRGGHHRCECGGYKKYSPVFDRGRDSGPNYKIMTA